MSDNDLIRREYIGPRLAIAGFGGKALQDAIAALPAVTVGVKPLVWVEDFADHPFGWYETIDCGDCIVLTQSGVTLGSFPTLDAAKAAAQADYEARILAALEPVAALTPTPVDDSQTPDPAVNDPVCTDCGGTGITYQTERRCACQGPDLSDPTAVHANMLRGTIAKPTLEQIIHLYGREAFQPMIDAARQDAKEAEAYAEELEKGLNTCRMAQAVLDNTVADLEAKLEELRQALLWCSGSADFNEGGVAREGWLKVCAPLLKGESHE